MCAIVLRVCAAPVWAKLVLRAGQAAALRQTRFAYLPGPSTPRRLDTHVRKPVSAFEAKTVGEDNHELAPCSATNRQSEIIRPLRGIQRVFPSTVIGKIDDDLTLGSASAIFDGAS